MDLKLIEPTTDYKDSYLRLVAEFKEVDSVIYPFPINFDAFDWGAFLEGFNFYKKGERLNVGFVSHSTFWMVDGKELIGVVNIRHRLNERLLKVGVHVGYGIRPQFRGQGMGRAILSLALDKCADLSIGDVLLTCEISNAASVNVILANGGVLDSEYDFEGGRKQRYWIFI